MEDCEDIKNWKPHFPCNPKKPFEDFGKIHTTLSIDAIKIYCLLKSFISSSPNGFYTLIAENKKPMDNMIWWDFCLCNKENNLYIWLWRTNSKIEVAHSFETDSLLEIFLNHNLDKYQLEIEEEFKKLIKHETYINHCHSYGIILKNLWKKYNSIEVRYPDLSPSHQVENEDVIKDIESQIESFTVAIVDKHVLGKSIVLFSSFYIESLISTLFRVGSVYIASYDKQVHSQIVKQGFKEKIQTIAFYTPLFKKKFDTSNEIFKEVFSLMSMRNKYTHTDKTAEVNRLGEVYFDGDFPVFEVDDEKTFLVKNLEDTYALPDPLTVKRAYELTERFNELVRDNVKDEYQYGMEQILNSNPVGYNTKLKTFSCLYPNSLFQFFLIGSKKK